MSQIPPPDFAISKRPEHVHQRILQAAIQVARPVIVNGKVEHMHTITSQQRGGRIEMLVYLTGNPVPVDAAEVALQPQPQPE